MAMKLKNLSKKISGTTAAITKQQLYLAARSGCAREVYEETGLDFRTQLNRFLPLVLYIVEDNDTNEETGLLINEYKRRVFFICAVNDEDFPGGGSRSSVGLSRYSTIRYPTVPKFNGNPCNLMLQLSVEHSGFSFEPNPSVIIEVLDLHSGGKVKKAISMASVAAKKIKLMTLMQKQGEKCPASPICPLCATY